MAKQVRVKIAGVDGTKWMSEEVARRFAKANPQTYQILEPETVEFISLPPIQKKSVEAAAGGNVEAPKSIGQDVPSNEVKAEPVKTTKTTQQALKV